MVNNSLTYLFHIQKYYINVYILITYTNNYYITLYKLISNNLIIKF